MLWASILPQLVGTLLTGWLIVARAAVTLALALLVELSQLYQAPWIDSIRNTTLGGSAIGFGFHRTDWV